MNKRKIMGTIIGIAIWCFCLIFFTYAYYTWKSENTLINAGITDNVVNVVLDNDGDVNVSGIGPILNLSDGVKAGFMANNQGDEPRNIYIDLQINSIDDELLSKSFKYAVVRSTVSSNEVEGLDEDSIEYDYDNPIIEGDFEDFGVSTVNLGIDAVNGATAGFYKVVFYIDGSMKNDSDMMEKAMDATLIIRDEELDGKYLVYNNVDGATGLEESLISITAGEAYGELPTPEKEGYTFLGWYENDSYTTEVTSETIAPDTDDDYVAIYAKWRIHSYNIVYNLKGGTSGSKAPTTTNNNEVVEISNPTRTITIKGDSNGTGATVFNDTNYSYTFDGWTASGINNTTALYGSTSSSVTNTWDGKELVKATYFKNLSLDSPSVTMKANWKAQNGVELTLEKDGFLCDYNTRSDGSGTRYEVGSTYYPDVESDDVTLYAVCDKENIKPTATLTNTTNLKAKKQTATLTCSDNIGVAGYYFGTSEPTKDTTYVEVSPQEEISAAEEINAAGTYYLSCKDTAGNISTTITQKYFNYTIKNMLLNVDGTKGTYNTSNYTKTSEATYLIPDGTSLPLQSVYNVPDGAEASTFKGVSEGEPSTTAQTLSLANQVVDQNTTFGMWFDRKEYTVTYEDNRFVSNSQTISGVTVTYDATNSYLTLNGTQTTSFSVMELLNQSFAEGEKYRVTLTHISGSFTKSDSSTFATDIKGANGSNLSTRNKLDLQFPTSGSSSDIFTVSSVGASEGKTLYSWIWVNSSGAMVYSNYKIKVVITKVKSETIRHGGNYSLATTPTRTGYTFNGWYTAESGGSQITNGTTINSNSNHTIFARWTVNTYKITFNANGGTLGTTSVDITYDTPKGSYPDITLPTRTGYTFNGYYDATSGGTQWYDSNGNSLRAWTKVSDTTLYAQWTANTYKITFNANGGTLGTSSVNIVYDTPKGSYPDITLPTRTGYTFNGYYDATSGGTQWYDSNGNSLRAWTKASNTTLYARWNPINYTVTIARNNTSYGTVSSSSVSIPYGTTYSVSGATLTFSNGTKVTASATSATGYNTSFSSWSPTSGTITGATTITANFTRTAIKYNVYFDLNYLTGTNIYSGWSDPANWTSWGTTPTSKNQIPTSIQDGAYVEFKMPAGTQGGPYYIGTSLTSGTTYTWNVYIQTNREMTLQIGSEQNGTTTVATSTAWREFSLTFTANSHTHYAFLLYSSDWRSGDYVRVHSLELVQRSGRSIQETRKVSYNTAVGTLPTPTKAGHNLSGWYTEKVYGSAITSSQVITGNKTYYAHWTPYTHTVAYNANGGSGAPSSQTKYYGGAMWISNTIPTKSYSVFQNWNTKSNGSGTSYTAGQRYLTDQNGGTVTLYAIYRQLYAYVTGLQTNNVLYINSAASSGSVIGRLGNGDQVWIHGESGNWWYVYAYSRAYCEGLCVGPQLEWIYGWVSKSYITTPQ